MIGRYRLELNRMNQYPTPYIHLVSLTIREGGFDAKAMIIAPLDSIYKHRKFLLSINGDNYPFKAPRIKFLTKIYHPSVDPQSGQIHAANVISVYIDWTPTKTLLLLLNEILELIVHPERYSDDGCWEATRLFKENRAEFVKNAEGWCQKYCEKQ